MIAKPAYSIGRSAALLAEEAIPRSLELLLDGCATQIVPFKRAEVGSESSGVVPLILHLTTVIARQKITSNDLDAARVECARRFLCGER
jgi:hypothetical protein